MINNVFTYFVAPVLGWLTLVSVLVVVYLAWLEIAERRHKRRLNAKRARLGLSQV
jgi:ABC-type protease/lipase transport system fused ATPase/permease subunit